MVMITLYVQAETVAQVYTARFRVVRQVFGRALGQHLALVHNVGTVGNGKRPYSTNRAGYNNAGNNG